MATNVLSLQEIQGFRGFLGFLNVEEGPMLVYDPMAPLGPNCGTCGALLPAGA